MTVKLNIFWESQASRLSTVINPIRLPVNPTLTIPGRSTDKSIFEDMLVGRGDNQRYKWTPRGITQDLLVAWEELSNIVGDIDRGGLFKVRD